MISVHATIAGHEVDLTHDLVERKMRDVQPEAIRAHYVVVNGRRFPPKQVIAHLTRLDRSAFITTQARRVLERLGFTVGRVGSVAHRTGPMTTSSAADERLAREANLLRPYRGQFVAVDSDWTEVVASGPDPRAVSRAVRAIGRTGVIFQVPLDPAQDIGGFVW